MALHPMPHCRKQPGFNFIFIADEIIVDNGYGPAPVQIIKHFKFFNDMAGIFHPDFVSEQ